MSQEVIAILGQIAQAAQQAATLLQQSGVQQAQPAPAQQAGGFGGFGAQGQQPAQAGGFGGFGGAQQAAPAQPTVTPDMIQQLITPMVQNDQIKAALTAQMQQMGIQNLPDARPDQLAELYSRFQQVEQQARAAGMLGGAPAGQPSLI